MVVTGGVNIDLAIKLTDAAGHAIANGRPDLAAQLLEQAIPHARTESARDVLRRRVLEALMECRAVRLAHGYEVH